MPLIVSLLLPPLCGKVGGLLLASSGSFEVEGFGKGKVGGLLLVSLGSFEVEGFGRRELSSLSSCSGSFIVEGFWRGELSSSSFCLLYFGVGVPVFQSFQPSLWFRLPSFGRAPDAPLLPSPSHSSLPEEPLGKRSQHYVQWLHTSQRKKKNITCESR